MRQHTTQAPSTTVQPAAGILLQRKCDCGNHTVGGGQCAQCGQDRTLLRSESSRFELAGNSILQRKLSVGATNDPLESEADRVADAVLTTSNCIGGTRTARRMQRQTNGTAHAEGVPDSVNRVLASPGARMNPALQENMERRFGQDFSRVRV